MKKVDIVLGCLSQSIASRLRWSLPSAQVLVRLHMEYWVLCWYPSTRETRTDWRELSGGPPRCWKDTSISAMARGWGSWQSQAGLMGVLSMLVKLRLEIFNTKVVCWGTWKTSAMKILWTSHLFQWSFGVHCNSFFLWIEYSFCYKLYWSTGSEIYAELHYFKCKSGCTEIFHLFYSCKCPLLYKGYFHSVAI